MTGESRMCWGHPLEEVSLRRSGPGDKVHEGGLRTPARCPGGGAWGAVGAILSVSWDQTRVSGGQGGKRGNRWRWGAGPQAGSLGGALHTWPRGGAGNGLPAAGLFVPFAAAASPGASGSQGARGGTWSALGRASSLGFRVPRSAGLAILAGFPPAGPRRPPPHPRPRSSRSPSSMLR